MSAAKKLKLEFPSQDDGSSDVILSLDYETLVKLKDNGCSAYYCHQNMGEGIYLPAGFLAAERTGSAVLIYGVRKSFCLKGTASAYEGVVDYVKASGKGAVRYEQVLEKLRKQ